MGSYTTKPESLWDLSKIPTSPYYHYSPPFLQHYSKVPILFSFLSSITKVNHFFPLEKACENKYFQDWIENYVPGKKKALMIRVRLLKKKIRKVKIDPKLGGQWKEKEKVLCLVANERWRRRFFAWWPMEGEGKILFTSFHFLPNQFHLNLQFFPLTLKFYFTMVLGRYLHVSSLFFSL